jgi:hypothetical protein
VESSCEHSCHLTTTSDFKLSWYWHFVASGSINARDFLTGLSRRTTPWVSYPDLRFSWPVLHFGSLWNRLVAVPWVSPCLWSYPQKQRKHFRLFLKLFNASFSVTASIWKRSLMSRKNVEWNGHGLFYSTFPEFAWRNWGRHEVGLPQSRDAVCLQA